MPFFVAQAQVKVAPFLLCRLTQDNNFVRLIRHDAVQASWPIRSSLLRSVATTNELDISEEHEHMRRRRIATK